MTKREALWAAIEAVAGGAESRSAVNTAIDALVEEAEEHGAAAMRTAAHALCDHDPGCYIERDVDRWVCAVACPVANVGALNPSQVCRAARGGK